MYIKNILLSILVVLISIGFASSQIVFQKTYGGPSYDIGYAVQQNFDGGYILAGAQHSFSLGTYDDYVIRTNEYGDTLWTRTYGDSLDEFAYSVKQTPDGGFIICGYTASFGAGNNDVYLIRINSSGDTLWTRTYGGVNDDEGNAVAVTNDGGFMIIGNTKSYGAGNDDVYMIRTNSAGDTLWTKIFGGSGEDQARSMNKTDDGGYIITGFTNSYGQGNGDVLLIKTDSSGNILFTKTYGWIDIEEGKWGEQTGDGGYALIGVSGIGVTNVYFIKTNAQGDTVFTRMFGGISATLDLGYSLHQTNDGGYILAGSTRDINLGDYNIYMVRLDNNYDTLWTRLFSGTLNEEPYALIPTSDGGFAIAGYTESTGAGHNDMYLIKFDSLGNGGCNQSNPFSIVSNIPIYTNSPTPLVSSGGVVGSTETMVGSNAIVTTLCSAVGTKNIRTNNLINIYPNPANDAVTIHFESGITNYELRIKDVMGNEIYSHLFAGNDAIINVSKWSEGVYFYEVKGEKETAGGKLVIQK
ncbi:MAG TPA: T9SS type A sorting domain-containing protein [Chitinophagales bacterium]|nr:T9SS type A sorting domain-containing protein [Chitinophagales bacterium]